MEGSDTGERQTTCMGGYATERLRCGAICRDHSDSAMDASKCCTLRCFECNGQGPSAPHTRGHVSKTTQLRANGVGLSSTLPTFAS